MGSLKLNGQGAKPLDNGPKPDPIKTKKSPKKADASGKKSELREQKSSESTYRKKPIIPEHLFKNRPDVKEFLNFLFLLGNDKLQSEKVLDKIQKPSSTPSTRLSGDRKGSPAGTPKLKTVKGPDGKPIQRGDESKYFKQNKTAEEHKSRPKTYVVRDYNGPYYRKDEKKVAPPKIPVTED